MSNQEQIFKQIEQVINSYPVILFMKGEKDMPGCGFSAGAVEILNRLGVEFEAVNILANAELRQAVKEYSKWPTYPQLYVKGELIGGYDIMYDLLEDGELENTIKVALENTIKAELEKDKPADGA
ncbi:Grx4 family monothiol glutaredoxin [Rickettsiales bacterium LUAb2]